MGPTPPSQLLTPHPNRESGVSKVAQGFKVKGSEPRRPSLHVRAGLTLHTR